MKTKALLPIACDNRIGQRFAALCSGAKKKKAHADMRLLHFILLVYPEAITAPWSHPRSARARG